MDSLRALVVSRGGGGGLAFGLAPFSFTEGLTMKLLTKEIIQSLPALGSTDGDGDEAIARVKFFNPAGSGTWYATEFDLESGQFFGLAHILETELGYFSLQELEGFKGRFGLGIERDLHWTPKTLRECREELLRVTTAR